MANDLTIYLHFPCFDGVISAVLASEYLAHKRGWSTTDVVPLGYEERETWVSRPLSKPAAVVDYLYHPDADLWADHHETTFATPELKAQWQHQPSALSFYDPKALSCAAVIWRNTYQSLRQPRFREMVHWANRIDGARYASVEEAVLGEAPALRINLSLASDASRDYCWSLIASLRAKSLAEVAASKEVEERYRKVRKAIETGQKHFSGASRLERDGIVVFHAENSEKASLSRYAPYLEYPKALYSVGILNSEDGLKITAMRNPWRHFRSVPLGQIFRRYGGGGHQRVASVLVKDSQNAEQTLRFILADLRRARSMKTAPSKELVAGD